MRKRVSFVLALTMIWAAMWWAAPARAIVWCHDYTYYRVEGIDPRPLGYPKKDKNDGGISAEDLQVLLRSKNYHKTLLQMPEAISKPDDIHKILKPDDVIIIVTNHSGFVRKHGNGVAIDHFIQAAGDVGLFRDVNNLPRGPLPDKKAGGYFEGDTYSDFLSRLGRTQGVSNVELWRASINLTIEVRDADDNNKRIENAVVEIQSNPEKISTGTNGEANFSGLEHDVPFAMAKNNLRVVVKQPEYEEK